MHNPGLQRLLRVLPAVWLGALLCLAAIATPAPFAVLDRADAGRVVAPMLQREAWLSLVLGMGLLIVARTADRRDDAPSAIGTDSLLLLGTLFCTVFGYFGLQPMMRAAKTGQMLFSFGQLHAMSAAAFAIKLLLVAALAWRRAARPAT